VDLKIAMTREEIETLTLGFTAAFNRDDLDGVMLYFAEDGVYEELTERRSVGKAAIRAAFEPQFQGAYGTMRFIQEDLFVDVEEGKAMISWICTLDTKSGPAAWRGLDLLHWRGDKLALKQTYCKANVPRLESRETGAGGRRK
jgi:ketosteroid isomerase-like protein